MMKVPNNGSGSSCNHLNAITPKITVNANFNLEPWLKLRTTCSFWLAPAYLNANSPKTPLGNIQINPPIKADSAEKLPNITKIQIDTNNTARL